VVALDLRGYGDSDKPQKISDYRMELLVKDVKEFVKALKRDSCILVGHDFGGAIAWVVAATCPSIVEKLVILNIPHPEAMKKKLQTSLRQFLKSWYIFFFQLPFFPELCYRTNDLLIFNRFFGDSITEEELEAYKYNWSKKGIKKFALI
jgi:pimeloyl-ACP methyl ester carboxylesterase